MNVGRDGMLERLNYARFGKDAGTTFDYFNSEGDLGTLEQMAGAVCSASPSYDMGVSLHTVTTQAVMRANKRALQMSLAFGTLQSAEILLGAMHNATADVKTIGCV